MRWLRRVFLLAATAVIAACHGAPPAQEGRFRAGTAKVKITPEQMGWMMGYANRYKKAEGVAQDLWARALALEDPAGAKAVLVTADIAIFPPELGRAIRKDACERYGFAEERLMLVASHTHCGPVIPNAVMLEMTSGLRETEAKEAHVYGDWLKGKVVEAIGQALAALEPAQLSFARGQATFAMNRRARQSDNSYRIGENPEGPTDPNVPVLWVESEKKQTRAAVFTYACHCTALSSNVYKYHGDYAGVAAETLERALPRGAVALFATGCGGDINPSPRRTFEHVEQHGQALAKAVMSVSRQERGESRSVRAPLRAVYRQIELPLEKPPPRDLLAKLLTDKNDARKRHSRVMLRLLDAGKLPSSVSFPLQVWRFGGDLTLIAIGGETCVDYALRLKKELGPDTTWVVGYANEIPCYIPSERVLAESGYEAGWDPLEGRAVASQSMMSYGWPVPFAPGIEERIVTAIREMQKP